MEKIILKDGTEAIFRIPKKEDAKEIVQFYNVVGGETHFLSFGANEFRTSVKEYEKNIENIANTKNSIIILATINEKVAGIAILDSSNKGRSSHDGTFGIVISQKYCNLGLGKNMMEYIINWAKTNGITKRISLMTNKDNTVARVLYEKMGFKVEGIVRRGICFQGKYYDAILMGLIL